MQFLPKFQNSSRLVHESKRSFRVYILVAALLSFIGIISVRMLRAGQGTAGSQNSAAEGHGVDLAGMALECL